MESVDLEMNDIFEEVDADDDVGALGALPDLPESTQNEDQDEDADQADVDKRLKALSKGAAKKVVRRPQPKLDADRLTGARGIPILPKLGEKLKFKGKNHEAEDLSQLMREMEHWAHRLFPKMPFDEVIERVEKLGSKGPVKTCIRKMRLDMPVLEDEFVGSDKEEDEVERNGDEEPRDTRNEEDMWDEMIEEQAQMREWEDRDAVERGRDDVNKEREQSSNTTDRTHDTPAPSQAQTPAQKQTTSATFTPEQLERMERNKQLALERKLKKTGLMSPALKKPPPSPSPIYTATPLREETSQVGSQSSSQNNTEDSENQLSEVIAQGTSQNVVIARKQEDAQKWCTQPDNTEDASGNVLTDGVTDEINKTEGEIENGESLSGEISSKSAEMSNTVDGVEGMEIDSEKTSDDTSGRDCRNDLNEDVKTDDKNDTEIAEDTVTDSEEMSEVIPKQNSENIVLKPVAANNLANKNTNDISKISKTSEQIQTEMNTHIDDKENHLNIKDKVDRENVKGIDAKVTNTDSVIEDEFDDEITEEQLMETLDQ